MAKIDHFMWAVSDLDEGMAWAADTFDCTPAHGGSHVGLGTRNALLSLGDSYLEIIAPDPAQNLHGTMGERLAALRTGGLAAWAASGDLNQIAGILSNRGVGSRGPTRTERRTAEDQLLVWELLFPEGSGFGGCFPFFIDWLECEHPAKTNPQGGRFEHLTITTPDAAAMIQTLGDLDLAPRIAEGAPGLEVAITCGGGQVVLASTTETIAAA
jgi:hypothetical protein